MKTRIYIVFISFIVSITMNACVTNKNNTAASSSSEPGSNQLTDESTTNSTPSPEDENSLPIDAYKAVLQNEVEFIGTGDSKKYFINDFLNRNSEYEGTYKVSHFTVIDMDGDQMPEVVLELSLGEYPEQYEILHYSNGTVYGYNFEYRGFEMLKEDGTYCFANSATDVGTEKILSFQLDSAETKILNTNLDQQNEKQDVQWYEFSTENIEGKIRMDLNTELPSATDNQSSYYGEWTVQKVLAYGIGTYSSDDALKLVGKSLIFSVDVAEVFTDQPSDTPAVINSPEYQETTISGNDFQEEYQMSFDTLGISTNSVTEVQVIDQNEVGGVFLIKDSDTIIMIAGGTYFELIK